MLVNTEVECQDHPYNRTTCKGLFNGGIGCWSLAVITFVDKISEDVVDLQIYRTMLVNTEVLY